MSATICSLPGRAWQLPCHLDSTLHAGGKGPLNRAIYMDSPCRRAQSSPLPRGRRP